MPSALNQQPQLRTDYLTIRIGNTPVVCILRWSRRRRKSIALHALPDRQLRVSAPWDTPASALEAFVRDHSSWVLDALDRAQRRRRDLRYVDGELLPYLGRLLPLRIVPTATEGVHVSLYSRHLEVLVPLDLALEQQPDELRQALQEWYRSRAGETLPGVVQRWQPWVTDQSPMRVLIRNQRARWGSCAADGTLRFSWRMMTLPPSLIDYIVVHELAHLEVPNHSTDFWDVVHKALPDATARRRALREATAHLPSWGQR